VTDGSHVILSQQVKRIWHIKNKTISDTDTDIQLANSCRHGEERKKKKSRKKEREEETTIQKAPKVFLSRFSVALYDYVQIMDV
jgi:hypothetical protein